MSNGKFAEMLDPRLLEASWHRFEAARTLAHSSRDLDNAQEKHRRATEAHMKACNDYENLERDIARGVRIGAGRVDSGQGINPATAALS